MRVSLAAKLLVWSRDYALHFEMQPRTAVAKKRKIFVSKITNKVDLRVWVLSTLKCRFLNHP